MKVRPNAWIGSSVRNRETERCKIMQQKHKSWEFLKRIKYQKLTLLLIPNKPTTPSRPISLRFFILLHGEKWNGQNAEFCKASMKDELFVSKTLKECTGNWHEASSILIKWVKTWRQMSTEFQKCRLQRITESPLD